MIEKLEDGKLYLISFRDWFMAPNGERYSSIYGKCKFGSASEISPSDMTIQVGKGDGSVFIPVSRDTITAVIPCDIFTESKMCYRVQAE